MQPAPLARSSFARGSRRARIDPFAPLRRLGRCTVFLDLLARTGLDADLADGGASLPLTVFVPDDDAFAALGAGSLDLLFGPSAELSIEVVEHHFVRGAFSRRALEGRGWLASVQGERLAIEPARDRLRVGGAEITIGDVALDDCVAHVVERVLCPAWAMAPSTSVEDRWAKFERDRIAHDARSDVEDGGAPCDTRARRRA